ncbi:DUF6286 domain-containing protein [Streptomyces fuscigenes]|uniref:DUF6286 domain-containing protein n=1 Tax=Streptomyces fuscigenes TaxID=1528880 RepID=UPI001F401AD5|nr:DUF6286 domain-containing protein [Streptomyces fuscigenes]MCF3960551.1 DUF6286 domain-containing protein [Streptomyces fuscigenes]
MARMSGPTSKVPRVRRPWSPRRGPATLCALLGMASGGAVLYDVVMVRLGGTPAPWRHALLERTYGVSPTTALVGVVAAVLLVAGLWLIWLALTPGARKFAPMVPPETGVRAFLDRSAVTLLLRDAALEVPGTGSVRIGVRRRKVLVRATVRYGAMDEVQDAVTRTLSEKRDGLGLASEPRLVVRVRPDETWAAPRDAVPERGAAAGIPAQEQQVRGDSAASRMRVGDDT